jgi:hypothetical protein
MAQQCVVFVGRKICQCCACDVYHQCLVPGQSCGHLDMMLTLKQRYGRDQLNFTLNILRFPSFQSALVLPDNIRNGYRLQLEAWLFHNQDNPCLHEHEVNHVQRLIDYLDVVKTPHSEAFEMPKLLNDFRQFYTQYDQRRDKVFAEAFPNLAEWYGEL